MKSYQAKPRLLFLYTELAGYFIACLKKLQELHDVEILVIHWDINKEAPFTFNFPQNVQFYSKNSLSKEELSAKVASFNPDFIYCSGWVDRDYLKIISTFKKKIATVIVLDNPWQKHFRQYVAGIISRFTILRIFTHCWVPGEKQKKYAVKLGFKKKNILMGMYSADVNYYNRLGLKYAEAKKQEFPKRFIYVGRYAFTKGIEDLWAAFIEWKKEGNAEWELWCLGTGDIKPVEFAGIRHFGFIQPESMERFIQETGVFILPSHFEPWGVALHEYAAAGFPLIASDAVGAEEAFIKNGENGFVFKSGDIDGLKALLKKIASLSNSELLQMGDKSRELAFSITPTTWAETIMSTISTKNK